MMIRIAILICSAYLCRAADFSKIWIVNSNTTNLEFWNSMITHGDVTFNASMLSILAVPKTINDTEGCDLIYPLDGQMTENEEETSTVSIVPCYDNDALERMEHIYWLDPRNWRSVGNTVATPHAERIPCDYGNVQIPNTNSTFIVLPPKPIKLRIFRFGFRSIGNYELKRLSKQENFADHFIMKYATNLQDMFNITSAGCTERTGCVCGTAQYQDEICSFVEHNCTKELPCNDPITPMGHCCPFCGSSMLVVFNEERFVYNKLSILVTKYIDSENKELNSNLIMHMSKVTDRFVQIVLVPKDGNVEGLEDLTNGLRAFLKSKSNVAVDECFVECSSPKSDRSWFTVGKIFIFLITVLIGGALFVYASKFEFFRDLKTMFSAYKLQSKSEDVKYGRNKDDKNVTHESNDATTQAENTSRSKSESTEAVNLIDTFN